MDKNALKFYNSQEEFHADIRDILPESVDVGRCKETCLENHQYNYPILVQRIGKSDYSGISERFIVWDQEDKVSLRLFLGL